MSAPMATATESTQPCSSPSTQSCSTPVCDTSSSGSSSCATSSSCPTSTSSSCGTMSSSAPSLSSSSSSSTPAATPAKGKKPRDPTSINADQKRIARVIGKFASETQMNCMRQYCSDISRAYINMSKLILEVFNDKKNRKRKAKNAAPKKTNARLLFMKDYRATNNLPIDPKDKAVRELCSDAWSRLGEEQKSIWKERASIFNENLKPAESEVESKEPVTEQSTEPAAETTAEPAPKKTGRGRKAAPKRKAVTGARRSKRVKS